MIMRIFVFLLVSLFCGCIHQAPPTIAIPQTPRVVIKEVPAIKNQQTAELKSNKLQQLKPLFQELPLVFLSVPKLVLLFLLAAED